MSELEISDLSPDSGHLGCPGCGEALSLRLVLEAIGSNAIMVIPACCASYVDGIWPHSATRIPLLHVAMGTTVAAAAGIRAALEFRGQFDTRVLAWAGADRVFESGLGAVASVAERNEDILCICYNSEPYAESEVPFHRDGQSRAIVRRHQPERPQRSIVEVMAAHLIPYCATACVAYPDDLSAKVRKAISITGFKFIHLLSPCPTQWEIPSELVIEVTRAAVQSRIFPLYEIVGGTIYTINVQPETFVPVTRYLSRQGRFAGLRASAIRKIQARVEFGWKQLLRKENLSNGIEARSTLSDRPPK